MTAATEATFLHPLPLFYRKAGHALPEIETVASPALPPAANRLLVHAGDMTSKLEEYFGEDLLLRVLQREHTEAYYRREVMLYGFNTGTVVEYGAIEIELSAFPEPLRFSIVEARLPLGGLMNRHGMRYRSEPQAFLRVAPDARLAELFKLPVATELFGRANVLLGEQGQTLARIVEIVRPGR